MEVTWCDSNKTDVPVAVPSLNSTFKYIFLLDAALPLASLATDCIAIPLGILSDETCPNKPCTDIISKRSNDILIILYTNYY